MKKAEPQKEHHWLEKFTGEWTSEMETVMTPGEPPSRFKGTETVRSLGGLWILAEGQGEMPGGGDATTLMTIGFDAEKKRFVGTWVGSMMTHLWVYDGALDETGLTLSLDSDGPSMKGDGTMAKYRDSITFKSDNHRVMTSYILGDDGQWREIMKVDYRRKK